MYIPELDDQLILEHLQKIQRESQTALSSKLEGRADGYNLTIEMETNPKLRRSIIPICLQDISIRGWICICLFGISKSKTEG